MPTPGRRGTTKAGSTPPVSTPPTAGNSQNSKKENQASQSRHDMTKSTSGRVLKKVQKFTPPRQTKK